MYLLIHSLIVSILSKIPKHIPIIKNVQFISIFLVCSPDRIRTCMITRPFYYRLLSTYSVYQVNIDPVVDSNHIIFSSRTGLLTFRHKTRTRTVENTTFQCNKTLTPELLLSVVLTGFEPVNKHLPSWLLTAPTLFSESLVRP